jgi:hypothetical protein
MEIENNEFQHTEQEKQKRNTKEYNLINKVKL